MILEGVFIYLPTIIAITVAFFVGIGVGLFLSMFVCFLCFLLLSKVPSLRTTLVDYFQDINKES
jgi:hypothetical protein